MLVVAVLTIIAFAFLYNTTQLEELADVSNPTIYGKSLTPLMIDRQVKNYQLTMALGQYDLLQKLGGTSSDPDQALNDFVWNLLVLRHEAESLGVEPTDNQIANSIKALPVFQTGGQFDPIKYGQFVSEQLAPRGFNERQLEEVMRDSLRLDKIMDIVEAPAAVGDVETTTAARIFQPITANYIKLEFDSEGKDLVISADEIAAFHTENQSTLQSDETRDILVATFALPADSNLAGRERVNALQKLAEAATRAMDALESGSTSLEEVAKAIPEATTKSVTSLTRAGSMDFSDSLATTSPEDVRAFAATAYSLPAAGAFSDIQQNGDSFQIVQLTGIRPPAPLSLEQATPRILAELRARRSAEQFATASRLSYSTLEAALARGESIDQAAAAQKLTVSRLENVIPAGEETSPEQRLLSVPTLLLKDGELSTLEQAPWGAFAVQLVSRSPASSEMDEQTIRENILAGKRDLLFMEWLRVRRAEARITTPSGPQG